MAITEWTSESMDWNDPDPLDAKYWEAIRLALMERAVLVDASYTFYNRAITYPVWDNESFNLQCSVANAYRLYNFLIDQIVPEYINHTTEADWIVGRSYANWGKDLITLWNTGTIFEEAGITNPETDLINGSELIASAKTMLILMYKVINLLRWVIARSVPSEVEQKNGRGVDSDPDVAWTLAEADYASDPYSSAAYFAAKSQIQRAHPVYVANKDSARSKVRFKGWETGGLSASWYPLMMTYIIYDLPIYVCPLGYLYNRLVKYTTESAEMVIEGGVRYSTDWLYIAPNPKPSSVNSDPDRWYLRDDGYAWFIVKFNGPNGFKFRDW